MKGSYRILVFVGLLLSITTLAQAQVIGGNRKIVIGTGVGGTHGSLGGPTMIDLNGDGNSDAVAPEFSQSRVVVGLPDAQGYQRVKTFLWVRTNVIDPLTGQVLVHGRTRIQTTVVDIDSAGFASPSSSYGEGVFTVGGKRYAASMINADVGSTYLRGDRHVESSMDVSIMDAKTGGLCVISF